MFARVSAFVVWALVAASVVFWVLRLVVHPFEVPSQAMAVGKAAGAHGDLSRLLGSAPVLGAASVAAPEAISRFKLIGVMAPKGRGDVSLGHYGLALIAVDGKPPRAFAVGASVESGVVLQSVGMRSASIASQGAPTLLLELPPLAEPATGRPGGGGPSPAPGNVHRTTLPPGTIGTLPQVPASMQNPSMAGQQTNGPVPLVRQPAETPETPPPLPAPRNPATSTAM